MKPCLLRGFIAREVKSRNKLRSYNEVSPKSDKPEQDVFSSQIAST